MVLLYVHIFYQAKLYSDMLLQVFFAVMQAIGWLQWLRGQKDSTDKIQIRSLSLRQILLTAASIGIGTLSLGSLMQRFTDADVPYPDALTTSISVLAQWWLNQRYLQNWTLWIVADVLYIGLYWYKSLYLTSVLYLVFLLLAIQGYREWKKAMAQ
jgi:nicotinamide mononucleotide transporter